MRLYDTARRAVVDFDPGTDVGLYTCGITPYDATHVGHAATYLLYDVLQRRLRDMGVRTRCIRNVTDVDDDILRKARELGVDYLKLAEAETARFQADLGALNVLEAEAEPAASSAIGEIQGFVATVLERGYAYRSGGAVYFSVGSFERFGQVSHLSAAEMLVLAAERGGNPDDPAKRVPLDFVLWQPSAPDEPAWDSPWGPGRPGWHVECSALALRHLGTTVDLHGGGTDLIFPHHECETAQSEAATGLPFVRHWLHAPMVRLDGVKMSKSLGNLVFVSELLKDHEAMAIRLAILDHSPSADWDWEPGLLAAAADRLDRWHAAAGSGAPSAGLDSVRTALDDNLDFPAAIAAVDEAAAAADGDVTAAAELLGILL